MGPIRGAGMRGRRSMRKRDEFILEIRKVSSELVRSDMDMDFIVGDSKVYKPFL